MKHFQLMKVQLLKELDLIEFAEAVFYKKFIHKKFTIFSEKYLC